METNRLNSKQNKQEVDKLMAKLSYEERKEMPKKEFGVPGARRFPMPDAAHARNALARLPQAKGLSKSQRSHIHAMAERILNNRKKSK